MNYRKYITDNPWVPCILVFALGMLLRLLSIGAKSLWVDEAYAAGLMEMNPMDLIRMSIAGSPHPPLAFLFLKFSTILFGQGEAGMRIVPAVASALAVIPLMLLIARRINLSSAVWAGLIWAVSPFAVSLGQEAWLYGIVSCLGFLFVYIADSAWHGSRRALYLIVPIALTGMLVQHMFGLFIAAGFALYFTVPVKQRIHWRQLALVSIIFAVLYSPFAALMLAQASFRAERISRASIDMAAVYRYRFLVRVPTVFVRLIPGGLLLEAGRCIIHDMKQMIFWLIFGAGNLFLLANLYMRNLLDRKFRMWLLLLFAVPFLIFLKEDPTVRHLTILWIPLGFAVAAASARWKLAGPVMLAVSAVMLLPYYNIGSFPYHRSDWRGAAAYVEERFTDDESILVLGGQSGGIAWDYYSSGDFPRVAHGGENPYSENRVSGRSAQLAADSLMSLHDSIWIVSDFWGGPRTSDLIRGYRVLSEVWISPSMEVTHISE